MKCRNVVIGLIVGLMLIQVAVLASAGGNGTAPPGNPDLPTPTGNPLEDLPKALWDYIVNAINVAIQLAINGIFKVFEVLFRSPGLVENVGVYNLWAKVLMITDALLGLVFVGMGIMYLMSGISPALKAEVKLMAPNLVMFMILAHFSIYICQFAVDLNDAMVGAVIGDGFTQYVPVMPPTSGIALALLGFIVILMVIWVGITLATRVVVLLFTTVLMPIACLCYVFPATRAFGKNIIVMFATWNFLTFFESIALVVAFIALGTMDQWVAWIIFLAALAFMASLPKLITSGMAAAGQGGGGGAMGMMSVVGTISLAATGVGAGAAGAAGAVKGAMGAASVGGKGMGATMMSGLSKAPMGFARGFGGAMTKASRAGPQAKLTSRLTNPVQSYRQEKERYGGSNGSSGSSGSRESSSKTAKKQAQDKDVGAIRKKYSLKSDRRSTA